MNTRRGVLRLLAAAPLAAGAAGKEALAKGGIGKAAAVNLVRDERIGGNPVDLSDYDQWRFAADVTRRAELEMDMRAPPAHIAAMKSWSPVYKTHVAVKEQLALSALRERIHHDRAFREKVALLMGFPEGLVK